MYNTICEVVIYCISNYANHLIRGRKDGENVATISSTITLVDKMTSKLNAIRDAVDEVQNSLNGISDEQSSLDKFSWNTFLSNAEAAGKQMQRIGKSMTLAITTPLVLLGKKMYGNAIDYESAFAGVQKTVTGTQEEYDQLYSDLLEISERTPTGFVEGASIMEMAGQLGVGKVNEFGEDISEQFRVATEDLTKFTEAYIGLQESTNIQGEEGAADLARFLNVTEKTTANVDRVGGVIVGLGNNFATTEAEILSMATRMGATADLAGFSAPEILAFSAALSSVGINAEAGGSAAGKLMKKMQLAAEVGGTAQERIASLGEAYQFTNGLDFSNWLAIQKKEDIFDIADGLGITFDAVQDLADSWVALDQFSNVMGLDQAGFLQSWDEGAAQSMLRFFQGLGNLDETTGNSVLAQLAEMDITEIRLSNLVAAMAGNSDIFQAALTEAYRQYGADPTANAMAEEVAKRYATQESQNEMLGNKLNNTMADFGQNLVEALNPALEVVNQLLDKFNALSESDQTALIKTLGAIALLGPGLSVVGTAVESVAKIGKIVTKIPSWTQSLSGFFSNPAVWGVAAAGGVATGIVLLVQYLDDASSAIDDIVEHSAGIQLSFDQSSVDLAKNQIAEVQEALDLLNGNKITEDAAKTSATVKLGYGTEKMFNTALAYESAVANAEIEGIYTNYGTQIAAAQDKLINATTEGERDMWAAEMASLDSQMNAELADAQQRYSGVVSELYNGIVQAMSPEAAAAMERASNQYDLLAGMEYLNNFEPFFPDDLDAYGKLTGEQQQAMEDAYYAPYQEMQDKVLRGLADQGYLDMSYEEAAAALEMGTPWMTMINGLEDKIVQDMDSNVQTVSDNPFLSNLLQNMLQSSTVTDNLDLTAVQGVLDGIVETLDFAQAAQKATEAGNPERFGQYLVQGLADGVTSNAGLIEPPFTTVAANALAALQAAFSMHSPSQLMAEQGIFIPQGLALGITNGSGTVLAAIGAVSNGTIATANAILNQAAGQSIGYNVAAGIAAGIRSGSGMAAAAARALANSVISTLRASLQVHSPSRVTFGIGENTGVGFVNGILDNRTDAEKAVGRVVNTANKAWNTAAWSDIALFAGLENDQLLDDAKDAVKISDADIRKIRDLAEREVINHFTTAKVEVEMTNNNSISSNMDLDGIVEYLGDKVTERLEAVAEGVYS